MKTQITTYLLCSLLVASATSFAQPENPGNRGRGPQGSELKQGPQRGADNRGAMLARLLEMNDAELAQLRQTIERVENMTPSEKERLRGRVRHMQDMPPERVEAMRKRYQAIPEETRQTMRQNWNKMSPEERKAWREEKRNMSPEERREALRAL